MKNSLGVIKNAFEELPFANRTAYKMNEHYNNPDITPIDVREIITVLNMSPIIKDIFTLLNDIECSFNVMASHAGIRYGTRKFSRHTENNDIVGASIFTKKNLRYIVPKGILYPVMPLERKKPNYFLYLC